MEAFEDNLERLRECGIGLGLDDNEIDRCMVEALLGAKDALAPQGSKPQGKEPKRNPEKEPRRPKAAKKPRGRVNRCCHCLYKVIVAIVVFVVCVYIVVGNSKDAEKFMIRNLEPIVHPVTRFWRLVTLPLAKTIDLTSWYEDQCAISNPFSRPAAVPCDEYKKAKKVYNLTDITEEKFSKNYMGTPKIAIFKKSHSEVHYTTLRTWYSQNKVSLEHTPNKVYGYPAEVQTLKDVLEKYVSKDIRNEQDFHVEWISKTVNPSRLLRKLFFRPSFISTSVEVSITKSIHVLAPKSPPYSLSHPHQTLLNLWYVQGAGSRMLYFVPQDQCLSIARPLSVKVEPGDIVYVNHPYWRIESAPVDEENISDINVAFIGSFM